MKNFLLMTIKWDKKEKITTGALAEKLQVDVEELDEEFGVVSVDEAENIYSYRITEAAHNKSAGENKKDYEGPYSDVRIEPFDLE